ncbi:hypothetical protein DINM_002177 [Dirofilaria immitis]|nr:hypothetical protein [Dirofilaria immitis]
MLKEARLMVSGAGGATHSKGPSVTDRCVTLPSSTDIRRGVVWRSVAWRIFLSIYPSVIHSSISQSFTALRAISCLQHIAIVYPNAEVYERHPNLSVKQKFKLLRNLKSFSQHSPGPPVHQPVHLPHQSQSAIYYSNSSSSNNSSSNSSNGSRATATATAATMTTTAAATAVATTTTQQHNNTTIPSLCLEDCTPRRGIVPHLCCLFHSSNSHSQS